MRSPGYIQCFNIHNIWSPEGEERRGFKMYLKTLWLKNSQAERMKQISRNRKKRRSQTRRTQTDPYQTYN